MRGARTERAGDALALMATVLVEERGRREGREGAPFSPPPPGAGAAAINAYRLAYHQGLDEGKPR